MNSLRRRCTYANVMSTIAVFLAVGGASAWAATVIDGRLLKSRSVGRGKLVLNTLTGAEIQEFTLTRVPRAAHANTADFATKATSAATATSATTAASAATATSAENASSLGGQPAARYLTDADVVVRHAAWEGELISASSVTTSPDASGGRVVAYGGAGSISGVEVLLPLVVPTTSGGRSWALVSLKVCARAIGAGGSVIPTVRRVSGSDVTIATGSSVPAAGCSTATPATPVAISDTVFLYGAANLTLASGTSTFLGTYTATFRPV